MGNMPTLRELSRQRLRTNLWFECGPEERASWVRNLAQHGGFDPLGRSMTPLRRLALLDRVQFVLDSIAAAFEEGLCDRRKLWSILFATNEDWREFIGELQHFDAFWVNERHFYAFLFLLGEESACTTYARIAKSLVRRWGLDPVKADADGPGR